MTLESILLLLLVLLAFFIWRQLDRIEKYLDAIGDMTDDFLKAILDELRKDGNK